MLGLRDSADSYSKPSRLVAMVDKKARPSEPKGPSPMPFWCILWSAAIIGCGVDLASA